MKSARNHKPTVRMNDEEMAQLQWMAKYFKTNNSALIRALIRNLYLEMHNGLYEK